MFQVHKAGVLAPAMFAAAACSTLPPADVSSMKFVEAEGVEVHVDSWGEGPPVLLIHGASSDMDVFKPTVIPLLRKRYFLAAYDRPGMGFTRERPPNAETLEVQAKVAADVIEQIGLNKPIVIAHSYGGAVALRLALDRPDLISGLVLIAPVAYDWPGGVSWHLYWSANPVVGGLFNHAAQPFVEAAARDGVKGTFAPLPPAPDYFERASVIRATTPTALRANGLDLLAAKSEVTAQQDRYPGITMPVAIMTGDRDGVVSPAIHSRQLAKTLPDVRLKIVHGAGHVPHEADPQALADLRGLGPRASRRARPTRPTVTGINSDWPCYRPPLRYLRTILIWRWVMDTGIDAKGRKKVAGALEQVLADTFALYSKTHGYHWNVEGPRFSQLHLLFETQYNELWASLDGIAERMRELGDLCAGA